MGENNHISLRKPTIQVTFLTEKREFNLKYDKDNADRPILDSLVEEVQEGKFGIGTDADAKGKGITDAIINLATENNMANDAGTFSLTLVGTSRWDIALNANDVVIIRANPSKKVENDVIMVGMISEVKKIGEYGNNSSVYAVTGLSMMKALMQMKLGTLQELASMQQAGWLYTVVEAQEGETGQNQGLTFESGTASSVVRDIINFFLLGYGKYTFGEGTESEKQIKDFITMDLASRSDEKLTDPTPYMSFQGSLRQFIATTQAKPFNEFYEEYTTDGKCNFKMRPTPFEMDDWKALPIITIKSPLVVEETLSRSDLDAYSVFNCAVPVDFIGTSVSYISKPQTSKALLDKYGYSLLEEENRYIFRGIAGKGENSEDGVSTSLDNADTSPISSGDIDNIVKGDLSYSDRNIVTAKQLKDFLNKVKPTSPFIQNTNMFLEAANKSGLSPVYILAHASLESGYGTSGMSHNYFGIGAYDSNPQNGHNYGHATMEEGIINGARWISDNYYKKGQKTLYTMRHNNGVHQYATDATWDRKIAKIMASIYKFIGYFDKKDEDKDKVKKNTNDAAKEKDTDKVTVEGEADKKEDEKTDKVKEDEKAEAEVTSADNQARLGKYSKFLFNWYADNPLFYSGSIRVLGHPDYRVGMVLKRQDPKSATIWEYYIESVSHDFSYTGGYTTVLGVTRGLPSSQDRFKHHYTSEDFLGGHFGEMSLEDAYTKAREEQGTTEGGSAPGDDDYLLPDMGDNYKADYDSSFIGTIYAPDLGGTNGTGITKVGNKVKNFRTCAVDPTVIPLGSIVAVKVKGRPELTRLWHAEDIGGAIKGKRIDFCVDGTYAKKKSFKGKVSVAIIRKGSGEDSAKANLKEGLDKIFEEINKKLLEKPVESNNKIVQHALKWYKGNHPSVYKWGGGHSDTPTNPFKKGGKLALDCSGYTGWTLYDLGLKGWTKENARYSVARTQASMPNFFRTVYVNTGGGLSASEKTRRLDKAKPGDFIFFDWNKGKNITHVGIYMGKNGDGKHYMISCAGDPGTPSSGIKKDVLEGYWLGTFTGLIRRVQW